MIKFILGFSVACLIWVWVLANVDIPSYKIYDCGMAEWHPDIPPDVKEECRSKRNQEWMNRNERKIQTSVHANSSYLFRT